MFSCIRVADVTLPVPGVGDVTVDVSYGGAFYVFVPASRLNLDLNVTAIATLADAAQAVTGKSCSHGDKGCPPDQTCDIARQTQGGKTDELTNRQECR